MVKMKVHAQEFTDFLNTVDDDIKWTTEGEVVQAVTDGDCLETDIERSLVSIP